MVKTFTDVIGQRRELKGNWIPGSGTRGSADIAATKKLKLPRADGGVRIVGQKVAIEIKNKDKQSDAQKRYQRQVEEAGGIYMIARVGKFEEFVKEWEKI